MKLYLVRHGQSTHNANADHDNPDPPLTPLGCEQAALAAEAVRALAPEAVALYASPQRRALQTAAPLHEALGLTVRVVPELCESGGLYQHAGLTRSEILREWPHTQPDSRIGEQGWWQAGETEAEEQRVYARAAQAIALLRAAHEGEQETVVVVTHGRFCGVFISTLLRLGPAGYTRFPMDNCGISLLDFVSFHKVGAYPAPTPTETAVRLRFHNRTDHLPQGKIT